MSDDQNANTIALLADMELLRRDVILERERLDSERAHARGLADEVADLRRRLDRAEERAREFHVLLLHRDEEVVRLHGYLRSEADDSERQPMLAARAVPEIEIPAASASSFTPLLANVVGWGLAATGRWVGRRLHKAE